MTPFTWRGEDCLMVSAIVKDRCSGCLFHRTVDYECPHTDEATAITCDTQHDIIFIRNTPEAKATYAVRRLEGK